MSAPSTPASSIHYKTQQIRISFYLTNSNQCFKKRTSHFNFNQLNLEPTFTKIQFLWRFDHGFILVQTI